MTTALKKRQDDLAKIMDEADKLQKAYEGKKWKKEDREKFEALCTEGKEIQDSIDAEQQWERIKTRDRQLREVPEPTLPGAKGHEQSEGAICGYISLGDAVVASAAFHDWASKSYARGNHAVVQLESAMLGKHVRKGPNGETLVPLTLKSRQAFEQFLSSKEAKAIPTLGAGVLDPVRVDRIPQVTADDRIRMRDVLAPGTVSGGSVEYVREDSTSGSAAETAHGVEKPELAVTYSLQTAHVRTIAGWMPVQRQQVEDWAQLRSLIDTRLRYSVQRREEEQLIFGDGNAPNLQGLAVVSGTQDIAANGRFDPAAPPGGAGHTLIDAVRMGITDVRVAGGAYEPNALVIHPIDFETMLIEKGTDARYVWAIVPGPNGNRIWGLTAVEAVGCQHRTTERRVFIVGDFLTGAQLLDRMQLTVQVGLIDRQFVENMMTILAENRVAFPIYAPAAFAIMETQEATS
jgi:HK97 family phage major capsid protein